MPANKDLKRLVRSRMQKTGESYTAARARLVAKKAPRVPAANWAELAGYSEDAVKKATGHEWKHWVGALDRAGAATWTHRDIARWLRDDHRVDGWWSQAVTVGYERIRGLREKGQRRGGGWDVNKNKTIGVSVAKLYAAFATKRARDRWLGEVGLEVRKATRRKAMRGKAMRMRWGDGTPAGRSSLGARIGLQGLQAQSSGTHGIGRPHLLKSFRRLPPRRQEEAMRHKLLSITTGVVLAATSASADTTVFSYRCPDMQSCPSSNGAGTLIQSELRYNVDHDDFTWIATFQPHDGKLPCALWLVVGEGPDPHKTTDQFAILYAHIASGRASAYVYDKDQGENSWQNPGELIETFPAAVTSAIVNGNLEFTLYVNTTNINNYAGPPNWFGLYFAGTIGFWIAALANCDMTFDPDGRITNLTFDGRTSYDRNDRTSGPPISVEDGTWGKIKGIYR